MTFTQNREASVEEVSTQQLYSIVVCAARELYNEELWIDYQLAEAARPSWYHNHNGC